MQSILLVEDDLSNATALNSILSNYYKVSTAHDGLEALDYLNKASYDLILSDIKMPKMDGMDLLRASKTVHPNIEFVLMTAHASVELAVEAIQKGASDFIQKPFRKAVLLRTLEKCLERQSLRKENQVLKQSLLNLNKHIQQDKTQHDQDEFISFSIGTPLYNIEKQCILKTLEKVNQDKALAAKILGIGTRTIYRKLEEYEKFQKSVIDFHKQRK